MLEKLDLSKKVSKEEYNRQMEVLGERLGKAQRLARDAKRPIIIVFEGWRGARRSALINEMMQQMDARGFNVYSSVRLRGVIQEQPFFSAFWKRLPALGHIAVYHRSWYYLKNANELGKNAYQRSFRRHEATRRHRPRTCQRSRYPADGRSLFCPRSLGAQ